MSFRLATRNSTSPHVCRHWRPRLFPREAFETIVVIDACVNATARIAKQVGEARGLKLTLVDGPGRGAGAARRVGMNLAAARLLARGLEDGLIACTDADSRPDPDWLRCQLVHVRGGARAIAGLVELDPQESPQLPAGVLHRHSGMRLSASAESGSPIRLLPITISRGRPWP